MKSISIFLLGLVLRLTETCAQTMPQAPTMDQFIGINIIADRADYQKAGLFRTVRIFQDWPNDAGIANSADLRRPLQPQSFAGYVSKKISCSLSYNRSRAMDFVEIYKRFRAAPALNQLAPEFFGIQDPGAFSSLAWYRPVCQNQVGNTASSPYYFGGLSSLSGETFAKLPVKRFGNALDYRNYAKWATLFAAQFGSKTFSGSHPLFQNLINWHVPNFRIAPPRVNIQYMEIWNEAEKFWKDQHLLYHGRLDLDGATNDAYQGQIIGSHQTSTIDNLERTMSCFRPDEYGAMLSAAYDGHGGAPDPLQQTGFEIPGVFIEGKQAYLGIKNVDPGIKVVFTGLVDFRHNYVKKTIDALYSTGGRKPSAPVPFDVLNFHHYSSTGGLRNNQHFNEFINGYNFFGASGATIGVHPELSDENLKDRVKNLIESLESTAGAAAKPFDLNSKEIWVSEFGYDSYLEPTPTHGATGVELPLNIRTSVEPAFSIVNASFESGTTSWVSDFANRGTTSNPQNVNAAWKSVPAYAGTNMAWIEAPPSTLPRIAWSHPQPYVVQPYTRYKISMWVQNVFNQPAPDADPAKNATPGFYWTANGQRISPTTSYIAYKDNNDWVQVSGYWFSGPSTNATFALMLAPKSVTNIPNSAFVMDAARSGFFDNIAETQGQWLMRSLLELSAGRSIDLLRVDNQ